MYDAGELSLTQRFAVCSLSVGAGLAAATVSDELVAPAIDGTYRFLHEATIGPLRDFISSACFLNLGACTIGTSATLGYTEEAVMQSNRQRFRERLEARP
ncbi:MAG: hypothetical protein H6868_09390 [Rhodospirillales bacterium]|nr:hypothetical protein [Rhodospirillales bacterium]